MFIKVVFLLVDIIMIWINGLLVCLYFILYFFIRFGFINGLVYFIRSLYCVFDIDGCVGLLDGGFLRMNKKRKK